MMERPFTAEMRSPTFSRPQRSVGLPSMMRPILWGITEEEEEEDKEEGEYEEEEVGRRMRRMWKRRGRWRRRKGKRR